MTPGWTLRDHVDHLADWTAEGIRAMDVFDRRGHWLADPEEGIDAWNERMVAARPGATPADTLTRYDEERTTMLSAVARSRPTTCARRTAGAGPTTACTATPASTWRWWAVVCSTEAVAARAG